MDKELKALLEKFINDCCDKKIQNFAANYNTLKFESLTPEQISLLRGAPGDAGKDFNMETALPFIQNIVEGYMNRNRADFTPALSAEQLASLKGAPGENGKDVDMNKVTEFIQSTIENKLTSMISNVMVQNMVSEIVMQDRDNFRLRFEDLTEDQIEMLKGKQGDPGEAGKNFDPAQNYELLQNITRTYMHDNRRLFCLSLSDLTDSEREQLRGEPGKNFTFEENEDHIRNIVADNFRACSEDFKMKFHDLTEQERESLRFKFEHLTADQLQMIADRAGRGQRGKPGDDAYQVALGQGFRGSRIDWLMSLQGRSAPTIKSAELKRLDNSGFVYLSLEMSDGTKIETNSVRAV